MITKIMVGVVLSLLVTLAGTSWWLTQTIKQKGALEEYANNLNDKLAIAVAENQSLLKKVKILEKRNALLMVKIDATETAKASLRKRVERQNNVLKSALRDQKTWAETPVPASVAVAVNDLIKRLSADQAPDGGSDSG